MGTDSTHWRTEQLARALGNAQGKAQTLGQSRDTIRRADPGQAE